MTYTDFEPEPETNDEGELVTQEGDEYETRGRTKVATRPGYTFRSSNKDLPVITPEGVHMTKDEAEFVVRESRRTVGSVYIVNNDDQEA